MFLIYSTLETEQRGSRLSLGLLCLSRSFEEEVKLRWSQASDKKFPFGAKYPLLKWPDISYKEGTMEPLPGISLMGDHDRNKKVLPLSQALFHLFLYRCHLGFIDWPRSARNNPLWPSHSPLCPNICGHYGYDFCQKRESESGNLTIKLSRLVRPFLNFSLIVDKTILG